MRQVALIAVLAQVGSFVPAEAAELRIVDRVFTRVGASDDIAGGQSTFMVEMTELADILTAATGDSLVILDEVGRGTSTADGFAIAQAVTEFLHDEVGATTLFATHHHDLTGVADDLPRARNRHFAADQRDGEVVFDHEIAEGAATASYGVEVASEAGVPDGVVGRARELVDGERADDPLAATDDGGEQGPLAAFEDVAGNGDGEPATDDPLRECLRAVDLGDTTPLEALNLLAELKAEATE
jgi:DNA mismatch repair protein MutS